MVNIQSASPYPTSAVRVRLVAGFPMERTEQGIEHRGQSCNERAGSSSLLSCCYVHKKKGEMPLIGACLIPITNGDVVDPLLFKRLGSLFNDSKQPTMSETIYLDPCAGAKYNKTSATLCWWRKNSLTARQNDCFVTVLRELKETKLTLRLKSAMPQCTTQ